MVILLGQVVEDSGPAGEAVVRREDVEAMVAELDDGGGFIGF